MKLNRDNFQSGTEYAIYMMGRSHGAACEDYTAFVESIFKTFPRDIESMLHAGIGIAGEAGEIIDALKKNWVYDKPLDVANLKEELGDILFYIVALADLLGTDLGKLQEGNMTKLRKRFPEGYTNAAAIARADKENE